MMRQAILLVCIGVAFSGIEAKATWAQETTGQKTTAQGETDENLAARTAPSDTANETDETTKTETTTPPARDPKRGPVTNMPLPRFLSLKGSEGNARRGPSLSHRIDWVFKHSGMPLRVTAEYGHWRRVEDRDGAGGWVHYSLLSGVRTAIVQDDMTELKARPDQAASVTALAQAGAIVRLGKCNLEWCDISADGEDGWVHKDAIWGVEADELRD